MPSITSWTRLEPRCRDAEMARTVSARLFDPLWMLTRQWQTGEFLGEDAGTPVIARARASSTLITRCFLGELPADTDTVAAPYDSTRLPLEVLVERESMRPQAAATPVNAAKKLRLVVEGGLHWLRLLASKTLSRDYRDKWIARYGLALPESATLDALDAASARYLRSMAGRVPDARRLDAALRVPGGGDPVIEPALGIRAADLPAVLLAAREWIIWWDALFSEPAAGDTAAWLPERLEHAMSVAGTFSASPADERCLTAGELYEGEIDWSDFDLDLEARLGAGTDTAFETLVQTVIPAPLSFKGAPAPRFWEFEDARIDVGLMSVGPTDLAHLMMIEYASSYGNDWYLVPLDLRVGSLTRIDSLVVTDTFGVSHLLRPIGDPALPGAHWSLYQLARHRRAGRSEPTGVEPNLFFLPPVLGPKLAGAPLEEVLFMRDEMANLAWAVEHKIEGPLEQALRRDDREEPRPPPPEGELPVYRLASPVPAHWIPLMPVQIRQPDGRVITRLARGAVLQPDGSQQVHGALGVLLGESGSRLLHDEEVPREGARVLRQAQFARWTDGASFAWIGRRKTVGRGEGSSGLRFDRLEAPPSEQVEP
ncbi:hypothetical protein [Niveibacterium sp. SC-1]|uniref:hypothetical protein n=1 Tax=Niveibacterium sp. SC-1 TaxID=3135646 RepID=UPI0031205149